MAEHSLLEAVNLALARALADDPTVILLGEDIGINGGVFRATNGLYQRFGGDRVRDTPLAETVIAGTAIGLASQGFRPVAEIQFMGFIYPTLDQLLNHASRLRTRTRGRLTCPLVIRAPYGGGVHAPEHHSESTEALFTHIPGLKVVIPGSPAQAYGLLLGAIADPDPVIFLEPKRAYRAWKEPLVDDGQALALGKARTLRNGSDVTLMSWGAMLTETAAAADALTREGIDCGVIDIATLKPLDETTLLAAVRQTGRLVIVHEAARSGGFGAEIAARVAELALFSLKAPIRRITGWDTVMPLPRLEHRYLPTTAEIIAAARSLMAYD